MVRSALFLLLVATLTIGARPAEARCVRGELVVHRYGQPDVVVLPESQCLVPTPFPYDVFVVEHGHNVYNPPVTPPTGTPTGAGVGVYVPF